MQNPHQTTPQPPSSFMLSTATLKDPKTTLSIVLATSLFSLVFFLALSSSPLSPSPRPSPKPDPFLFPARQTHQIDFDGNDHADPPPPPSIAYLISGSSGDMGRIIRLLSATYHPRNRYLLHLDRFASQAERDRLAINVQSVPIFKAARNVDVIGKADFVYPKGSSSLSFTLHGASLLLRLASNWDWFISLNAGDYPLVTQDDLLHILSYLPKGLNFVSHSSYIGWRESKKLKPIIVDPGLYLSEKTAMFYASQKRELPNAYRIFTGSSFAILSRDFVEFCILGTDNLPRTLLMYFSNTPSALSNYFPTILCNSHQFKRTIINHSLRYANFDKPSKEEPRRVISDDFDAMIQSGAAFAAKFPLNDPLLDRIDTEILSRGWGDVVPGGWCLGEYRNNTCSVWGDADVLRPGTGAKRLEKLIVELLSNSSSASNRCMFE
ncbi:Glycosyl transferase [Parasponia andersonii]|uniref:Glycosyl transferase n=1 Tax=Parasponia andersonii TaxID=3476 RepID=A0A2P5AV88_PARAD|nr:Glycosyl transferase [Parasponia andersonii]